MRWEEYGTGLEDRLQDLHGRVHRGAYQTQPSKRRWIPRANGKQRPLGIAAINRAERGEGKPEAFTFLGFQHICGKNRLGRFEVRRITDGKRRRKKLLELKQELRWRMHAPIALVGEWLRSVLRGYYQYHAVPGNLSVLSRFRRRVARFWHRTLCRRSQRRPTWEKLGAHFDRWLPAPRVVHEFPDARFRVSRLMAAHPK